MKKRVITALALALALTLAPAGGMLASVVSASSNNSVNTGTGNNTGTGTGNNTEDGNQGGNDGGDINHPGGDDGQGGNTEKPGGDDHQGGNTEKPGGDDDQGSSDVITTTPSPDVNSDYSTGAAVTVTMAGGNTITSSVATTNTSSDVKSVAMSTSKAAVNAAAGLSADRLRNGQYVKLTVASSQCGDLAKQAVTNAASAAGGRIATILEIDLDVLSANGAPVEGLKQLAQPVEFVISAPVNVDAAAYDFAVIRLHDGQTDILPDLDNDPNTVTFASDRFSVYAVAYGEKGSFDAFRGTAQKGVKDRVLKTGDTTMPVWPLTAAGLVLGATAVVLRKKAQYTNR